MDLNTTEEILDDLKSGRMVIIMDDEEERVERGPYESYQRKNHP